MTPPKPMLDTVDLALIRALQEDARANISELAKNVGLTKNSLGIRLKKLKAIGLITGSIVQVDLPKFGYQCLGNIGIKAVPSKMQEVLNFLRTIKEIDIIGENVGSYNIFLYLFLKDINELHAVKERIRRHPGVLQAKVSVWINTEKALARPENISLEHLVKK